MSWFSNLFTRKVVLVPMDLDEAAQELQMLRGQIKQAKKEHEALCTAVRAEQHRYRTLRADVAQVRVEKERLTHEETSADLCDIIERQNAAFKRFIEGRQ